MFLHCENVRRVLTDLDMILNNPGYTGNLFLYRKIISCIYPIIGPILILENGNIILYRAYVGSI
jgi:hypothetical protein